MAVTLTAVDRGAGPTSCSDLQIVGPDDATRFGCPVRMKTRTAIMSTGQLATVQWELRDSDGKAIDLTACLVGDDAGTVVVKFQDVLGCCNHSVYTVDGDVLDEEAGIVTFTPPAEVRNQPGLWRINIALKNSDGEVLFVQEGWLSVEQGLFSDYSKANCSGPPTLGEIRIQLRDIWVENSLNSEVEFSDAEIMHSIVQPVRYWNEVPPDVGRFTTANFPYKHNWLMAIVANLLLVSAQWYMRNKAQISAGGAGINDLDKDQPYAVLALRLREEYKAFVRDRKIANNMAMGWGSMT